MNNHRRRTRLAAALVAGTAALSLTACANYASAPTTTAAGGATETAGADAGVQLVSPGHLTVCTHLSYKPFEFTEGNEVVGFDMDLMDLVAEELGVTREVIDIDFGQITSGAVFTAQRCDVGAAAITINDERAAATGFSEGYFSATQALLVSADSSVTGLEDLRGQVVGAQTDTTGKSYVEEHAAEFGYEVRIFEDMPTSANAVLAGTVAAAVNDNGVFYDFARENPTTKVATEFQTGEDYGFNYALDNEALGEVIDQVLTEAREDGRFNDIYRSWFGVDAPAS
ncbi:transporter substrate-binding domain-containing protein [Propioniciclava soli]|uniref:Transporter substrate-binding domain-containing protein n=1 Tax=Propioniciclava soli TaxID=2775081 RepID=A0ABZ3CEQ3_9ACTN